MNDIGLLLRILALALLIIWRIYWLQLEITANKAKPKRKNAQPKEYKRQVIMTITLVSFGIVGVQLLGIEFFTFPITNVWLQLFGFIIYSIGFIIAVRAGHDLGTNWARCYDYQIKDKQELVTNGIYAFIRHPIYSAIMLFFIGAELIVQSYLVFVYLLLYPAVNLQAQWEEQLLVKHFGDKYRQYMTRTTRFIPYLW